MCLDHILSTGPKISLSDTQSLSGHADLSWYDFELKLAMTIIHLIKNALNLTFKIHCFKQK